MQTILSCPASAGVTRQRRKRFPLAVLFALLVLILAACGAPATQPQYTPTQPESAPTQPESIPTQPESQPAAQDVLPQRLYFLAKDDHSISQLYRMERDGKQVNQLTSESADVLSYDVSAADGRLAYEINGQLLLADSDGSERRVLKEQAPNPGNMPSYHPAFSPDGRILAYGGNGLNLYDLAAGSARLVLEDQYYEPSPEGAPMAKELYYPEKFSPDGKKLLVAMPHWEQAPSHGVYDLATGTLVRYAEVKDYIYCCSFHGGPAWSPDSASFYGVASAHDFAYQSGELWKVDASSGAVTRMLQAPEGTLNLPEEVYPAPDGHLYFFFGSYSMEPNSFDAPVLNMVRSGPDGVTGRTQLRSENFAGLREALWAPDASLVIVVLVPGQDSTQSGGPLDLYYTGSQQSPIRLVPFGQSLRWGP